MNATTATIHQYQYGEEVMFGSQVWEIESVTQDGAQMWITRRGQFRSVPRAQVAPYSHRTNHVPGYGPTIRCRNFDEGTCRA